MGHRHFGHLDPYLLSPHTLCQALETAREDALDLPEGRLVFNLVESVWFGAKASSIFRSSQSDKHLVAVRKTCMNFSHATLRKPEITVPGTSRFAACLMFDSMDPLVPGKVEIRKCNLEDFDAILPLLHQLYPDRHFDLISLRRVYDLSLAADRQGSLCAICDQRVVGFGTVTIKSNLLWCETLIGYVSDMVVDREYRARGIGTLILDGLISWAQERGCGRIEINTSLDRKAAHAFYQRRGFKCGAYFYSKSL